MTEKSNFIINLFKGKKEGVYVELGAYHSEEISDTHILEKNYDWTGVSFEIDKDRQAEFNLNRSNPCMGDALKFNYLDYFEKNNFPNQIDYLSVDIDDGYSVDGRPMANQYSSLHGLISLPLTQYRFSFIAFEHDANMYYKNIVMRDIQREILDSLGYVLLQRLHHEDWWVDPKVFPLNECKKYLKWVHL
jgi:hypothetical protein